MTIRNLSIQRKLVGIIMLSSSAALLLAYIAFTLYELINYRNSLTHELAAVSQIVAESSTAALTFGDPKAAQDTLAVLRAEPKILAAAVYSSDGRVFARYVRSGNSSDVPSTPSPDGARFQGDYLLLFQPIMLGGDRAGTVFLKTELKEMGSRLRRYAAIGFGVFLLASLVTLGISARLQGLISKPILDLAETASRVSKDKNYSVRASKLSDDEIGTLVDRFNEMMAQIHARDLALQSAQDELEQRVEQRTQALQLEIAERKRVEEDLRAAKVAAEESNRAKSAFLANMSHELRTPLNAIIGYSEMLEEESAELQPEEFVPDLRKIQSAGRHLLALINDVLDLSKIEAGRMEVHLEAVSTGSLVDQVVATVEPLVRKNQNRFVVKDDARHSFMHADIRMFRQALINLVGNACKFTERGVVTLQVIRTVVDEKPWLQWHVRDTGIGISPEHMTKLFQSFSQVDASTTRKFGGTGLGLAISQRLCVMMGGRITVESVPGEGSTFTLWMPELIDGVIDSESEAGTPQLRQLGQCLETEEAATASARERKA